MGGGLMQLVAMGAQDVFLTGNPQITFFKIVYRRHTNFSKECIRQDFTGDAKLGSSLTCTLSRNGDLVQEVYFKGKFSVDMRVDGYANRYSGVRIEDITNLIKTVEVEIGGQKIDKHYTTWLDIYNELFETKHDYQKHMCGAKQKVESNGNGHNTKSECVFFIPLRFWFNRNPGLALPLIALQYHEVKVVLELSSSPTGTYSSLLVNYLYLDTDERRRFAQVSHEYLIEQVQHTGKEDVGTPTPAGISKSVTLTFNHPVKALFWNWSMTGIDAGKFASYTAKLQLNGHDRASEQTNIYFNGVQPYECGLKHTRATPATIAPHSNPGMYSFCLKPGEHQPSGSCNFSRIDNARLNLDNHSGNIEIFALNYNVLRIMSGMGGLTYSN